MKHDPNLKFKKRSGPGSVNDCPASDHQCWLKNTHYLKERKLCAFQKSFMRKHSLIDIHCQKQYWYTI